MTQDSSASLESAGDTRQYNASLDVFRLLACLAIIWIHVPESELLRPTTAFARFAVPFFSAAAIYLVGRAVLRRPERSVWEYSVARFRSIYLPFLIWSLIYYSVRWAANVVSEPLSLRGVSGTPELSWETLLNGTAHHLWFLPYIMVASLLAFIATKFVVRRPSFRPWMAILCIFLGVATALMPAESLRLPEIYSLRLAYDTIPCALWTLPLALYVDRWSGFKRFATGGLIGLGLFVLGMLWIGIHGRHSLSENIAGLGLLLIALPDPLNVSSTLAKRMGEWSFGIYVVHILCVEGVQDVLRSLNLPTSPASDVGVYLVAVVGSLIATIAASRVPGISWLFNTRVKSPTSVPVAA